MKCSQCFHVWLSENVLLLFLKYKGPKSCRSHRVRPHTATASLLLQHCYKHWPKSSAAALIWQKIKEECWNICPALTGNWSVCQLHVRGSCPSLSACLFISLGKFTGQSPLMEIQIWICDRHGYIFISLLRCIRRHTEKVSVQLCINVICCLGDTVQTNCCTLLFCSLAVISRSLHLCVPPHLNTHMGIEIDRISSVDLLDMNLSYLIIEWSVELNKGITNNKFILI